MLGGKAEKRFEGLSKLNIIFIFTLLSESKYIFVDYCKNTFII